MINRILNKGVMTLAAAICLLPATGFASTVFTMSGFSAGSTVYNGSVLTIDYTDLTSSAGTCTSGCVGSYVETYNNGTGAFSLTGTNGISLTFQDATGLVTTNSVSFSLYTASTSLVSFNSAFLTELGLASNPPQTEIPVALQAISASVQSNDKGVSATTQMTIIPEPSTFVMLGIALLSGVFYTARRRSSTN